MNKFTRNVVTAALSLLLVASAGVFAQQPNSHGSAVPGPTVPGPAFHDVRPGYGVTHIGWLSDYHPGLKGTPGDSRVYYLDSGVDGGTVYVQGGTHGNEIAGVMAATLLVERAVPTAGRLIVVPHGNNANVDYNDGVFPDVPEFISIEVGDGVERQFRYGSRRTNPAYEAAADPEVFVSGSGETLDGSEIRNLNRVHPGEADGTLTQQIAYGIRQLLLEEQVDVAFDLHEASVGSRLENVLVSHPRGMDAAVLAILELSMDGLHFNLEPSQESFRGLSHREWGDHTQVLSFLTETGNPGQTRGFVDADIIGDANNPLNDRVGRQLAMVMAVIQGAMDLGMPPIVLEGVPTYADLIEDGLGPWLNAPTAQP